MRIFLLTLALAAASVAADIPAGSHVLLRVQNAISSRTAKAGDFVYMQTATPIAAEGGIVVPVGSFVQGVIVDSERPGRVKGRGTLAIRLETLTLANGRQYTFQPRLASVEDGASGQRVLAENRVQQGSTVGTDIARIAIFSGYGAFPGAIIAGRSGGLSRLQGAGIGAGVGMGVGFATALGTRGRDVVLNQGSSLDVVFEQPMALD